MYERILVAVDDSDVSERALDEAVRLARQCGSRLRIVNVVDEVSLGWRSDFADLGEIETEYRGRALALLDKAAARAREKGADVDIKVLELDKLRVHVADMIAAEADAWPAELIVIGSHGRRGVRRLMLGSVAEGVMRIASKPVLLVRAG